MADLALLPLKDLVFMDVSQIREEYKKASLSRKDLPEDPFVLFEKWMQQAFESQIEQANAMALATVNEEQQPSLRTVLLKYYDERGFVFFTNYGSRKAVEIEQNPRVALLFSWIPLQRQIRIRGLAERASKAEALKYFATRPRGSQLGAWVSPQSTVISSRALLTAKFEEMKRKFAQGQVPLPDHWGGYRVRPQAIEFWQGRESRLHDRFLYELQADDRWEISRLAP